MLYEVPSADCWSYFLGYWRNPVAFAQRAHTTPISWSELPISLQQSHSIIFLNFYFYFMYTGVLPASMSVWGCWIPWNRSYRWFWAAMWVLGIEPVSSGRAVSAPNPWVISPAQTVSFLVLRSLINLEFSLGQDKDLVSFLCILKPRSPKYSSHPGLLWRSLLFHAFT